MTSKISKIGLYSLKSYWIILSFITQSSPQIHSPYINKRRIKMQTFGGRNNVQDLDVPRLTMDKLHQRPDTITCVELMIATIISSIRVIVIANGIVSFVST